MGHFNDVVKVGAFEFLPLAEVLIDDLQTFVSLLEFKKKVSLTNEKIIVKSYILLKT